MDSGIFPLNLLLFKILYKYIYILIYDKYI